MRGEYLLVLLEPKKKLELPPRARRILFLTPGGFLQIGTTSACAENTLAWPYFPGLAWNYLRVRGEYSVTRLFSKSSTELPPRARRIRYRAQPLHLACGTTSACAENTRFRPETNRGNRNYLRVRGEYVLPSVLSVWQWELPPRARRILLEP